MTFLALRHIQRLVKNRHSNKTFDQTKGPTMQAIMKWLNLGSARADQWYIIAGIAGVCLLVYCIFLGAANRIVFYRNKADMLVSFMAWVLALMFAWFAMTPENKELFQKLCLIVIGASLIYNIFMAFRYNPSFWLLAIPIGISRAILGLFFIATWVELLFGNTNRRRSKTIQTGILAGILTTLVFSLVNGDEVIEWRESQKDEDMNDSHSADKTESKFSKNKLSLVLTGIVLLVIFFMVNKPEQPKTISAMVTTTTFQPPTTHTTSTTSTTTTTDTIPTTTTTSSQIPQTIAKDPVEQQQTAHEKMWSPSFDCAKASNFAEKMICSNSLLGQLDGILSQNYRGIFAANIGDGGRNDLKKTQKEWLLERNKCSDIQCLIDSYKNRIEVICTEYAVISGVHPGCVSIDEIE